MAPKLGGAIALLVVLCWASCSRDLVADEVSPRDGGAVQQRGDAGPSDGGIADAGRAADAGPQPGGPHCSGGFLCPSGSKAAPYPNNGCLGDPLNVGSVLPDLELGVGCITPGIRDAACKLAAVELHFLYCSGYRYALIDISASWCVDCQSEALELPNHVDGWLRNGGVVLSVLEEGPSQETGGPASLGDLHAWWANFDTDFPMAIDPQQWIYRLLFNANPWGFALPVNIIVDLSTMQVVTLSTGFDFSIIGKMDSLVGP
jgi:hypothetical protein